MMNKTDSASQQHKQLHILANAALYWAGYFESHTQPSSSYPYKGDIIDSVQAPVTSLARELAALCAE